MLHSQDGVVTFPTSYHFLWFDKWNYDYLEVEVCSVKCIFDGKVIVLCNKITILSLSCILCTKITPKFQVQAFVVHTRESEPKFNHEYLQLIFSGKGGVCFVGCFLILGH